MKGSEQNNEARLLDYLRRATLKLHGAEERLRRIESERNEPIAIVAVGCRYPGAVRDEESFWRLLDEGIDAVTEVPLERWDIDAWYDPDPDAAGKMISRWGGFLNTAELERFDAPFFGLSPGEARSIDPQLRLLLETSWEALERAGISPERLMGSDTGVYVGLSSTEYQVRAMADITRADAYSGLGTAHSAMVGRLSYWLGLKGPAMAIDTACSSSLVAVHLACQALRSGECSLALAGGVNVTLGPENTVYLSRLRALSPTGRCRTFSNDADGYVRAEGAGMVVLERLSDARTHGHEVLALIRGSAVNQDGRSSGLTAPNGPSQEAVIREALARGGVEASSVDYLECHGTGTPLGDPIEVQAAAAVLGQGRDSDKPLVLGSVKSNIGHTEGAAGVAGIIKAVLALRHGRIPKTLHVAALNAHVPWQGLPVHVAASALDWPRGPMPRRAGVSSFGFGGTNAHVVLEEAPAPDTTDQRPGDTDPHASHGFVPILLSGKSELALRAQAEKLRDFLDAHPDLDLLDVAYSLATTRAHFEHRAVLVTQDKGDLRTELDALAGGTPSEATVAGRTLDRLGKLVFVFSGQGSHWPGMARTLLREANVFRTEIERCEHALSPHVDWSLMAVLEGRDGAPSLERVDVVQPVLFAVMVALVALWRSFGIEPNALVGHSQGEIAAAYVAGALSLEDAVKIIARRSRALTAFVGQGSMAAVQLSLAELEPLLDPFQDRLSIAAINGPSSITIAGENDAVETLLQVLESRGAFALKLRSAVASHCSLMEPLRKTLSHDLAEIQPRKARIPLYSTVTASPIDGVELEASYWFDNLRRTVRFADAVERLVADGHRFFVEVSPHPLLMLPLQETLHTGEPSCTVGSLWQDEGDLHRILLSLGELHVHGYGVDWTAFLQRLGGRRVALPTYAFQRERYWLDAGASRSADVASAGLTAAEHPMLGAAVAFADGNGFLFTARVSLSDHPWLSGHVVFGHVLLPGTAVLELALVAARHVGLERVEELTIEAPLLLSSSSAVRLQLSVGGPGESGRRALTLYGREERRDEREGDGPWTRFATGTLAPTEEPVSFDMGTWPPRGATALPIAGLYERLREAGGDYGPEFQGLRAVYERGSDLFAEVVLPEAVAKDAPAFGIHPALLDAAIHALSVQGIQEGSAIRLPHAFSGVTLLATGATTIRVRIAPSPEQGAFSLDVADASGQPALRIEALTTRPGSAEQLLQSSTDAGLLRIEWSALPATSSESRSTDAADAYWVVLGDDRVGLRSLLEPHLRQVDHHLDLDALKASHDGDGAWPDAVVVPLSSKTETTDLIAAAHLATEQALTFLQAWLADDRTARTRLILLTHGAVATAGGDVDLVHAPLWGLVRSAQNENPDVPLFLVDSDDDRDSRRALATVSHAREPQVALRRGHAFVPRLAKVPSSTTPSSSSFAIAPQGTVLITGGTGTLGGMVARHLARTHSVKHLLLASRQGPKAEGALALKAELESLGAEVTLAACDVADRPSLEALLKGIAQDHPLTAVVHTAGTLDDGLFNSLTGEQLRSVFRAKLDAAVHLHALTEPLELAAFVLYSSAAGVLGSPGQANYAAANVFLDALAEHRRARGLPALSLDWGYWQDTSGLTARLSAADRERIVRSGMRSGMRPITEAVGLALFDTALARPESSLVAAPFDTAVLAKQADALPTIFRGLVRTRPVRPVANNVAAAASLEERLRSLSEAERDAELLKLVRTQVGLALGKSPDAIDRSRPFKEIGVDSLTALEIRNRLAAATGHRLHPTLLFNYPTPNALAQFFIEELAGLVNQRPKSLVPVISNFSDEQIRAAIAAIATIPLDRLRQAGLVDTLMQLASEQKMAVVQHGDDLKAIATMSAAELVRLALSESKDNAGPTNE
ncbi:type I polyketide synthase [Pendulispora rubella]|uniref:Type I polyketide synthase n=1 Tax=Pendulispora rubella TaxID=2741070 RepID=A0ABZ2KTH1_9BACT